MPDENKFTFNSKNLRIYMYDAINLLPKKLAEQQEHRRVTNPTACNIIKAFRPLL